MLLCLAGCSLMVRRGKTSGNRLTGDHVRAAGGHSSQPGAPRTFGDTNLDIWGHHHRLMDIWGIDCLKRQRNGCVHSGTPVFNSFGRLRNAKKRQETMEFIVYVKVSRKLTNGETNAKKLITRPIMTVTSPNSPHIALTYTKLRFDHFFDHTYPPSWS